MGFLSNLFGGNSSGGIGNSASQNDTDQADLRIAAGDGSVNTSNKVDFGTSTGNTYTTTDYGAIDGALQLAMAGIEGAQAITSKTVEANGTLLSGVLKVQGEQQQQFTSAVENIKTSDVRVLIVTGLAVVGVVAVMIFRKT